MKHTLILLAPAMLAASVSPVLAQTCPTDTVFKQCLKEVGTVECRANGRWHWNSGQLASILKCVERRAASDSVARTGGTKKR